MIIQEFFKICNQILRFDKNFFKNENNFGQASIYFAIVIIILGSIISIIPNSSFLNYMSNNFNLGLIKGPSLKAIIITAIFMWFIKTTYLFFVGVILFPGKKTKCNYRKILILVAYSKIPLLLNFLIFNPTLLFLSIITYIWYNISLIIGFKIFLSYENYLKPALISLTPHIVFFIYILSLFQDFTGTKI
tara:strand:- start:15 stop:584 length:570 start_codon:yes stop_codon:yes gene_type:complete